MASPDQLQLDSTYVENEPVELEVKGHIPSYAAGTLFRTGAGQRSVETNKGSTVRVHHWFDNLSVNHRFQIIPQEQEESCKVIYNSRSTCDGLIARIKETGLSDKVTFGSKYDPCMTFFQKVQSEFRAAFTWEPRNRKPDEASVAVTMSCNFPGLSRTGEAEKTVQEKSGVRSLCNKTDANVIQFLDPETLEPIGIASQEKLHPDLKGPCSSAHMQTDPITGDVFNFNMDFSKGNGLYRVFTVDAATGTTSILATITSSPAYLHSFFLTENYVILCVWNSLFEHGGASILWKKNFVDALKYDTSKPARWYVIDRNPPKQGGRGVVATYESDPFYCFHTINAYEDIKTSADGKTTTDIIADLCVYESLDILKRFYMENMLSDSPAAKPFSDPSNRAAHPRIRRYRLPSLPSTSSTSRIKGIEEFTSSYSAAIELPTTNPNHSMLPYRYVYGSSDSGKATFMDGILKYDMETQCVAASWSVFGHCAGEPIFVPKPDGNEEDDGVLLTVVLDCFKARSYLLVLDAKDFSEVGRAEMRGVVGFGFHGTHFPDSTVAQAARL